MPSAAPDILAHQSSYRQENGRSGCFGALNVRSYRADVHVVDTRLCKYEALTIIEAVFVTSRYALVSAIRTVLFHWMRNATAV
jgi:hypothetical protein